MPSTRSLCGIVNTSSVGRFGANAMPVAARRAAARPKMALAAGRWSGRCPGPCSAARGTAWRSGSRAARASASRCVSHAATGSGRSSRHSAPIASHSRGTCCVRRQIRETRAPPTPAPAAATTDQLVWLREMCSRNGRTLARHGLLHARRPARAARPSADRDRSRRSDSTACPASTCSTSAFGQPRRELVERIARRVLEARAAAAPRRPRASRPARAGLYALAAICRTSGAASSDTPPLASGSDDQQPLAGAAG